MSGRSDLLFWCRPGQLAEATFPRPPRRIAFLFLSINTSSGCFARDKFSRNTRLRWAARPSDPRPNKETLKLPRDSTYLIQERAEPVLQVAAHFLPNGGPDGCGSQAGRLAGRRRFRPWSACKLSLRRRCSSTPRLDRRMRSCYRRGDG